MRVVGKKTNSQWKTEFWQESPINLSFQRQRQQTAKLKCLWSRTDKWVNTVATSTATNICVVCVRVCVLCKSFSCSKMENWVAKLYSVHSLTRERRTIATTTMHIQIHTYTLRVCFLGMWEGLNTGSKTTQYAVTDDNVQKVHKRKTIASDCVSTEC